MSDTVERFIAQAEKVEQIAQELQDATNQALVHLNNAIVYDQLDQIEQTHGKPTGEPQ